MDESFRINIAIKPPADIEKYSVDLSRELSKNRDCIFVLDSKEYFPHVTLYAPVVSSSDLSKVAEEIEKLVKNLKTIQLIFTKITASQGYISADFDLSEQLEQLQKMVIDTVIKFKLGNYPEEYQNASDYRMEFSQESLEAINETGSVATKNFHPHITLIRLRDENSAQDTMNNVKWRINHFTATKVGIYKMGENGTCIELLKEFTLGSTPVSSK